MTAEQKKKGWMSGIQEENKNSKGQVSKLVADVKSKKVTATSYTDDAWEASAREMGIFVDSKGELRAPRGRPQSFGPVVVQEKGDGVERRKKKMTSSSAARAEAPARCQPSMASTTAVQRENNPYHRRSHSPPVQAKGGCSKKGLLGKGPPPLSPNTVAVNPDGHTPRASRSGTDRAGAPARSWREHRRRRPLPPSRRATRRWSSGMYWAGHLSWELFSSARELKWQMQRRPSCCTTSA